LPIVKGDIVWEKEGPMFTLYTILKWVHVVLAIIAVGFNASYGVWIARAAKSPEHQVFALRGVKILDDRFANPAYVLLLVTGTTMVLISPLGFTDLWILLALILYGLVVVLGAAVYTPILRKEIQLLEAGRGNGPEFAALARRGGIVGGLLGAIVIGIVFLMVTKPTL
jgi:uncharacterized membrane protein